MKARQIIIAFAAPVAALIFVSLILGSPTLVAAAEPSRRFDRSDSDKRYLHHIELYDIDNRKITPESDRPYSPQNTCGRCHDYETISHGFHFNAFHHHTLRGRAGQSSSVAPEAREPDASDEPAPSDEPAASDESAASEQPAPHDGRPGEPWVWTDERTGTQLPLSYRDWPGRFNPAAVGISELEMTQHFGGRLPGGGAGASGDRVKPTADSAEAVAASRWELTGDLEVDCMVCHGVSGAYDFELRRDTIASENFAWAPTAAIRLGQVDGSVARIKAGSDPSDPKVQSKLPKVKYDSRRFNPDGTVFIDLVRKVENNACYQCHSQRTVTADGGLEERWVHDQDVHLRAGMSCTDCHRNGIDHQITRGFEHETLHPGSDATMTTLSCAGCHLGTDFYLDEDEAERSVTQLQVRNRPGRLGAPRPLHAGLPPIHFEKLTCTACHSGPVPTQTAAGLMTSLAHGLGMKGNRSGKELPNIHGPLFTPGDEGADDPRADDPRVTAARGMWPAYWGELRDGKVHPLSPEKVYSATRRSLRVRRGFIDEISRPEPSSRELTTLLGDERGKVPATERTPQEQEQVAAFQLESGQKLFDEKVAAALAAIEQELGVEQAVYVSTGTVYTRADHSPSEGEDEPPAEGDDQAEEPEQKQLREITVGNPDAVEMLTWPLAHNVRPAGWSLGATGCVECHADDGLIFASTVTPSGPAPAAGQPTTMASLQGIAESDRLLWNQLFAGRAIFKVLTGISLAILALVMLLGVIATARHATAAPPGSHSTGEAS